MTSTSIPDVQTAPTPTLRQLTRTTAIAFAVAVVILITIVLPAEYAIYPIGTCRLLGLTDIASPPVTIAADARPAGAALKPIAKGPVGEYPAEYTFDVFEVTLQTY